MQGSLEGSDGKVTVDVVLWRDLPMGGVPGGGLQMGSHEEACGRVSQETFVEGPMQRPLERGVVARKSLQTGLWRGL